MRAIMDGRCQGVEKGTETKRFPAHDRLIFRIHALRQMFLRRISDGEIVELLKCGIIIEDYPEDHHYASCLVSGKVNHRPLHAVMAYNNVDREAIVITAYEPDPVVWSENFTRR
jgi:hypothetical protein